MYDQGSWFVAIAAIKEFMFVLVWGLAICSLKYTWGCEGLWTPQYIHQISQGLFTIVFRSSKRIELDFESTTKTISQKF